MATTTRTYLVDDLDGSEDALETVQFSLGKDTDEIDLGPANAAELRGKLAKFVDNTTRVRPQQHYARGSKPASTFVGREQTQAVRDWAKHQGNEVSARGRIAKATQEAFDAAH